MAFDTQITDLVGGTIDQVACDQWAADACKEIIHQLYQVLYLLHYMQFQCLNYYLYL